MFNTLLISLNMLNQKIRVFSICTLLGFTGAGIYFGWKLFKKRNIYSMIKKSYLSSKNKKSENYLGCDCKSNEKKSDKTELSQPEAENSQEFIFRDLNSLITQSEGFIPGVAKIMVKNFGCNHNRSDSESMMGLLSEYGYTIVYELDECDLIVINSCTVKGPSQDSCKSLIELAKSKNKFVVVAGCVPQADINLNFLNYVSVIGVRNIHRIVEVVELTLQGNIVSLIPEKTEVEQGVLFDTIENSLPPLLLPKIRHNPLVEIITISIGCLGNCTYCKTKHSRGDLGSYPIEDIINRINQSLNEGVKQFWLTSEDVGAYGKDIGTNISELLREILKIIPEDIMIRIGMTNPPHVLDQVDDIVEIMKHPNIFEFLHIPVQSGSNRILNLMKRDYMVEDFCLLADSILKKIPLATIATDIICGFPGESYQDHIKTVELIKKYKFPVINISKFYPRPGTPAAKMKPVPNGVSKNRSSEITSIFLSYNHNEYIFENLPDDKIVKVWFIENSEKSNHTIGHTKYYNKVLVEMDSNLLGKYAMVKLTKPHKWHIEGVIIN